MENIKYQVFLSSTYNDLYNERKQAFDILLMADCIPAGMESFVATDEEQFAVITKVIDLCDYYVLIIGGRYGSIDNKTGLSFTEMEYDYAIKKQIPVLVFAQDYNTIRNLEDDDTKRGKLAEFRAKAMCNRLASVWKDSTDLCGKVSISIMRAKQEIKRPGWCRVEDISRDMLLKQIFELQIENDKLISEITWFKEQCNIGPCQDVKEYHERFKFKLP